MADLPLQVLLATIDTNAAVDLSADLAGIDVAAVIIQGDADKNNPTRADRPPRRRAPAAGQARRPGRRGSPPLPERGSTVHDGDSVGQISGIG